MTTWRHIAIRATALAVAFAAPALSAAALGPHPTGTDSPPVTTDPTGTVQPGQPVAADGKPLNEVVHSWALAPAGSDDPSGAGGRPDLSYVADKGSVIDDAVTVYNYSNVQLTFRVYATDAFNNAEGAFDLLPGSQVPTGVGSWVTLLQENVTVQPLQQATLPFTLSIPPGADPGDYAGAVVASNETLSAGEGGDLVTVDRRTGTRLNLRINGPLRPELAIENLTSSYHPAINPFGGSVTVSYRIQNRGNVRLAGTHSVSVAGPFGVGKRRLPADDFTELLPGQGVDITRKIEDVPALLIASTEVELTPVSASAGGPVATATRSSTSFAPPLMLMVVLALLFAYLARRRYRRHRVGEFLPDDEPESEQEFEPVARAGAGAGRSRR